MKVTLPRLMIAITIGLLLFGIARGLSNISAPVPTPTLSTTMRHLVSTITLKLGQQFKLVNTETDATRTFNTGTENGNFFVSEDFANLETYNQRFNLTQSGNKYAVDDQTGGGRLFDIIHSGSIVTIESYGPWKIEDPLAN